MCSKYIIELFKCNFEKYLIYYIDNYLLDKGIDLLRNSGI